MIFIFFVEGGGGGGGVLGVLIGGSELKWEMWRTGWRDRRGALCTRVHINLVLFYDSIDACMILGFIKHVWRGGGGV
jgi:hypothetical protein